MSSRALPYKLSALHHRHVALGAAVAPQTDAWRMPLHYGSVEAEVEAIRKTTAVCDISAVAKLSIHGHDLASVLPALAPERPDLPTGAAATAALGGGESGGRWLCCRPCFDEVWVVSDVSCADRIETFVRGAITERCAHVFDLTSSLAAVKLCGPRSPEVLAIVTPLDLSPARFADLSCTQTSVAGVTATIVRVDVASVPGYDIFFPRDSAECVWDALLEGTGGTVVVPFGLEALRQIDARA